jgi:hypothetical protein
VLIAIYGDGAENIEAASFRDVVDGGHRKTTLRATAGTCCGRIS